MRVEKRLCLLVLGLSLFFFGCTSMATKQAIQGDYDNTLRLFNKLPHNAKECAPQAYAKTEATLAHVEHEISEQDWRNAKKYIPSADELVRNTKRLVKRKCPPKPATPPPPPPPPPVTEKPSFTLEGITFDFDQATIRPSSEPTLQEAGKLMERFPSIKVRVEGYTDSIGSEVYNQKLSEKRADSVKAYLEQHYKIDPGRIESVGFGESKPIADNKSDEGRKRNRRIKFVITEQ
ncbi:MAG: OmpA family protein [Deltaproteobacteria bacterium]|nr:OmpA family protein [Deltaproteobacteria bacterium]